MSKSTKAKPQPTLAFPARKNTPRASSAKKPSSSSSSYRPSKAKSNTSSSSLTTSVIPSTPQKEDDDVQLISRTRSSPRSEPIARTRSNLTTEQVRASLIPGTWSDVSDNEVVLRQFDLDYQYGPCGGLSRRDRWRRADKMGLTPPQHVWDILSQLDEEGEEGEGEGEGKGKRRKFDVDKHSIFENVTARILEAEGRAPP